MEDVKETKPFLTEEKKQAIKSTAKGYFEIIKSLILKPSTTIKEEINNFEDMKKSFIFSLIISGFTTIVNLIVTMFNTVRVKNFFSNTVTWEFNRLGKINYIQVIGKNFLIYLAIIFVIASVYYIGSLIVKKQVKYSRLVAISCLAIIPTIIVSIISPIVGLISTELSVIVSIVGFIYSFIILYEGMNNEIKLENDIKYYFNLGTITLLFIVSYFILLKVLMSGLSSLF